MLIKRARGWEIYEREATPESVFLSRRQLLAGGAAIAGATTVGPFVASAQFADPTFDLYPAKRNDAYKLDRDLTAEKFPPTTTISTSSAPRRASPRRHAR